MNVASVIVDVATNSTNRPFDYIIPNKWNNVVKEGMRVVVPFGPRNILGYVIGVKQHSDIDNKKLKPIKELLDIEPVLNRELLKLGFWLSEETLCFTVSAFQAMLPAAIRAKYEKHFVVLNEELLSMFPDSYRRLIKKNGYLKWEDVANDPFFSEHLSTYIQNKEMEVQYIVKNKVQKKMIKYVIPNLPLETLKEYVEQEKKQTKQKIVLEYLIDHYEPIQMAQLMSLLQISDSPLKTLAKHQFVKIETVEAYRDPYANREIKSAKPFSLTEQQQIVINPILASIEQEKHQVFLLHGVTGSGKTEVYLQSIQRVLDEGKEAIVLVPEIALTPQMVYRFKARFGSRVAVMHSGLSVGEKYDEWRKIQRKEVQVVVGARSAIFAPFENLGIIIIDEEHESSYKQDESPRYHAKDVAIMRGSYHGCPVVLGSATPTLESFARAQKGVYQLLTMNERMNKQALPDVNIVDMREELKDGNRSMFSKVLFEKMVERLQKKEQIVLFLNRRGYSNFTMCRDCGYVIQCPHCDISLTYHKISHMLRCHYCDFSQPMPTTCPSCQSDHIRFFGTGTQKVEEELNKLLPEARVIRMDVDTTAKKGAHERLLKAFGEKKGDILLGTQMIAKGLDFPDVTLVGVLSADTSLHLPDFRASEKTYQLLTQVSGRAGRHHLQGEVVIQTYTPEHYSIQLAKLQQYDLFYQQEMIMRRRNQYPPYYYIVLITVSHQDLTKVIDVTDNITSYLRQHCSPNTILLGPSASPIPRIKDRYRYQCILKYKVEPNLNQLLKHINNQYKTEMNRNDLRISIDFNPLMMM
ncbi:MAG: primosomal protein N' [Bacillaceae bacterium]